MVVSCLRIFVGLLLTSLCACTLPARQRQQLTSPSGRHTVAVWGRTNTPALPLTYADMRASMFTGKHMRCENVTLHTADWFDSSFSMEYGPPGWLNDSTLRYPALNLVQSSAHDRVSIANESASQIPCIKLNVVDLLLVTDLAPGQKMEFDVSRRRGGPVWVAAETRHGSHMVHRAEATLERSRYPMQPLPVQIAIHNEGIRVVLPTPPEQHRARP